MKPLMLPREPQGQLRR